MRQRMAVEGREKERKAEWEVEKRELWKERERTGGR